MVRGPYVDKNGTRRGAWSKEEDSKLRDYVLKYGHWNWRQLPKFAGLTRCGKSCRLRWMNYLKPGIKRGNYTPQEEELILELHAQFGSRWSMIANQLPGRIDNDIKNHWNSHLRRRAKVQAPNCSESTANETQDHRSNLEAESESSSRSSVVNSKQIETGSVSSALTCDFTAQLQDSPSRASMESFWTQPFDTDHDHFHFQIPASLEEEIMRPFSPYLDEINMDCWLQELMQ